MGVSPYSNSPFPVTQSPVQSPIQGPPPVGGGAAAVPVQPSYLPPAASGPGIDTAPLAQPAIDATTGAAATGIAPVAQPTTIAPANAIQPIAPIDPTTSAVAAANGGGALQPVAGQPTVAPIATPLPAGADPVTGQLPQPIWVGADPNNPPIINPPVAAGAPVAAGGPVGTDQISALVQTLQSLLQQLSGLLQSMQGQAAITAGGPGATQAPPAGGAGCGCGMPECTMGAEQTSGVPDTPVPPDEPANNPAGGPAPAPDPAGGDIRKKLVDIAAKEVGTKEEGENAGAKIVEYRKAVTGAGEDANANEPWCADFVSWVFKQAGVPIGKEGAGDDWTVSLKQWAEGNGRWRDKSAPPQPGDMIMFDWEGDGKVDHVGMVDHMEGNTIHTIEGNSSDQVKRNTYDMGSGKVLGFISAT